MKRLAVLLLVACAPASDGLDPDATAFLRGAVLVPGTEGGERWGDHHVLVPTEWTPGAEVRVGDKTLHAPRLAECLPQYTVDLGDVSRYIARGGEVPDTALSFSPAGDRLAVGSFLGEILVVARDGTVTARRHLSEAVVKTVAWSADGQTLYAGEQSPDAYVYALSAEDLSTQWSLRLADRVGSTPAPDAQDVYGVYALPGAFGLDVLTDGSLLVAAAHGWPDDDGRRRHLSQLLRLSSSGEVLAAWPEEPVDAAILHPRVDPSGLVAVPLSRLADGDPPPGLPIPGVQVLSLPELVPVSAHAIEPLPPYFREAFLWEAVDVSAGEDAVLLGLADGRVRIDHLDGTPRTALSTGTPILAGDVPLFASVGHGSLFEEEILFVTASTSIPYGAAAPDLRPPSTHPSADTVWSVGLDGAARWTWHGPFALEGLTVGFGRAIVGAGPPSGQAAQDRYGALVFDLTGPARGGGDRLVAFCATAGPVFFRHAIAQDGRIAVAEAPEKRGDDVVGAYRVVVLR